MPMKHSWFHHLECTTQQADELMARYRQRGVKVERSLNPDFMTWTVSAQLVEDKNPPRPDSRWRNRMWGVSMANLRKAARGRECTVRIPGYCNGNPETSVLAHYRLAGTCGTGCKPDDTQAAIACNGCHDVIDGRTKTTDFTYDELRLMHAEGVMRTLEIWRKEGLIKS
ncbi:82 prophage-derived uncharacterized protein ybcO [Klebsiella pneumoniae]|nr:82 prophage-derived uncharacterized protein ybcO [Klebsiella pneumoniae]